MFKIQSDFVQELENLGNKFITLDIASMLVNFDENKEPLITFPKAPRVIKIVTPMARHSVPISNAPDTPLEESRYLE